MSSKPEHWNVDPADDTILILSQHVNFVLNKPIVGMNKTQKKQVSQIFIRRYRKLLEKHDAESKQLLKPLEKNSEQLDELTVNCKKICRTTLIISFIMYMLLQNNISISPSTGGTIFGFSLDKGESRHFHLGMICYLLFQYIRIAWSRIQRAIYIRTDQISKIMELHDSNIRAYELLEASLYEFDGVKSENIETSSMKISSETASYVSNINKSKKRIDGWELGVSFLLAHYFCSVVLYEYWVMHHSHEFSVADILLFISIPALVMFPSFVDLYRDIRKEVTRYFEAEERDRKKKPRALARKLDH